MNRCIALVWVLLIVTGCFAGSDDKPAAKVQWVQDLSEGLRMADAAGTPAMLYFTADWCAPCVELKKYVFTDKRVAEASLRLVNIYIDVDKNPDALSAYRIRGIPAIFFLNPKGEIVERLSGDRSVSSFVKQMTAVANKYTR